MLTKKIKVLTVLVVFLCLGAVVVIFWTSQGQESPEDSEVDVFSEEQIAKDQQTVSSYLSFTESEAESIGSNVSSVSDLDEIDPGSRELVALQVANSFIDSGSSVRAQDFINYLLKFESTYALEATKLCYQIAETAEEKTVCFERAQTILRNKGLLEVDQQLPESYFNESAAEEG